MTRSSWPGLCACVAAAVVTLGVAADAAQANQYFGAPVTVTTDPYTFGQAPVFMPDGRVVVSANEGAGTQVYISNQDGSDQQCLTCELPAPNAVPAVRPQGDWILFHSWMGHQITLGAPGFGGIGSSLFVMHPDGSDVTRLTGSVGPAGELLDDYHAYWSPDGNQIVWAHLNGNFLYDGGRFDWDIRVANFVDPPHGSPYLTDVRVVRPDNGHWYETQWWAPNGSGFLYTESDSTTLADLYFCRLTPSGCQVTQLTNDASWNEQAVFTPDGRDVIFMSTRDHPGLLNSYLQFAEALGIPSDLDNLLVLPVFEFGFEQPFFPESTDLWELDLATGALRRLTTDGDDGWVIPEFAWDPTHSFLLWTEGRMTNEVLASQASDLAALIAQALKVLGSTSLTLPSAGGNVLSLFPTEARTRMMRFDLGGGSAG